MFGNTALGATRLQKTHAITIGSDLENFCVLTFVCPPDPLHAVPVQRHPGELAEGFADVEVAQRGNLKTRHFVSTGVVLGLLGRHLALEREVQSVAHEHFGDAWSVLLDLLDPPVYALEAPFVGDIVH